MTTQFKNIRHSVKITFVKVTLLKVNWLIRGFDVAIMKSNLSKATFKMETFSGDSVNLINMTNSTVGQLKISAGYHMTVSDCNINGTTRLGSTFINADNSNITILIQVFLTTMGKPVL